VEWGDVAGTHLPGERLEVRLDAVGADAPEERMITLTPRGPSWHARDADLARVLHGLG
jgi:hypothetical protein